MKKKILIALVFFYLAGYLHGRLTTKASLRVEFHPPIAPVMLSLFNWKQASAVVSSGGAVEFVGYRQLENGNTAIIAVAEFSGIDVSEE